MTSYMLKSELDAITAKHKHQWGEGMVTADVAAKKAKNEIADRFVHNAARDIVRKIVAEYEPHP